MKLELKYVNRELKIERLIFQVFLTVDVGKKCIFEEDTIEILIYLMINAEGRNQFNDDFNFTKCHDDYDI